MINLENRWNISLLRKSFKVFLQNKMSFRKQLAHCSRAERISMTKFSNFQPLPPMKKNFLWGILWGIPYNKLTSIININHHRSRTELLAYCQELSNPTVVDMKNAKTLLVFQCQTQLLRGGGESINRPRPFLGNFALEL